jgi:hypothetical protein
MTGNLVLSTANSQVGIGTDNMQIFNSVGGSSGLVVTGVSSSTAILGNTLSNITIANGDGTADNTAALHFAREDTDGNPNYAGASVVSQFKETQVTGQYPKADLAFLTSTAANNAPSEKMRIDAAGNVGIGVVPESDWYNGGGETHYHILQIGPSSSVGGYVDNSTYLGSNWKDDGNNKYINTDEASVFKQSAGKFIFQSAPSGSANAACTLTTRLEITNDGRGLSEFTAKAWVNFNGAGTVAIRDSHNVSSIGDDGVGHYYVYFSNNLANSNYPVVGGTVVPNYPGTIRTNPVSVSRCRIWTSSSTGSSYQDASVASVMVFGD